MPINPKCQFVRYALYLGGYCSRLFELANRLEVSKIAIDCDVDLLGRLS